MLNQNDEEVMNEEDGVYIMPNSDKNVKECDPALPQDKLHESKWINKLLAHKLSFQLFDRSNQK